MIKSIFIIFVILLFTVSAFALDWYFPNQQTIVWDAVSVQDVSYNIYLAEYGDYGSKVLLGNTLELFYVVTIPRDGKQYIVGGSSVAGEYESEINWSDTNGASTPNPFAFRTLSAPLNLRRQEDVK